MIKYLISFVSVFFIMLIAGCSLSHQHNEVESVIKNTKVHFVPDSRVERFEIKTSWQSDSLLLRGETTRLDAKNALLDSLSARHIAVIDSITVLPSRDLNRRTYGLVNNSVANIRSEPKHAAQLATQALLGMPLEVLKQRRGWYLVRTPDDYLSWVDSGGIVRMDQTHYDQWKDALKLIYTHTYGFSYRKPVTSSEKVTDLVAGNILKLEGSSGSFYKVTYPDGRKAFVSKDEAKPFDAWNDDLKITKESLVETAKTMMGAPYLWGGTSTKGVDCSGFTKTIYFMNGRILPRDASQQVHAGKQVDNKKNWKNLEVGDLLFFGHPATDSTAQRVVHVGMWIGDAQFIHSSGRVRISSVDSTAQNYDPYNIHRYLEARRYLDDWQGNIIQTSEMYDLVNKNKPPVPSQK